MSNLYTVTASEFWHGGTLYRAGETLNLSPRAAKYLGHALRDATLPEDPVEPEAVAADEPVVDATTTAPVKRPRKPVSEIRDGDDVTA